MKLVYLLMVLSNNEPLRGQPIYFAALNTCTATARKLNYQGRKYYSHRPRPVKAWCEPRWVRKNVRTF